MGYTLRGPVFMMIIGNTGLRVSGQVTHESVLYGQSNHGQSNRSFIFWTEDASRKHRILLEIKIKLRSFKSSEHINEKGDGPHNGFGNCSLFSDPIDLATWS